MIIKLIMKKKKKKKERKKKRTFKSIIFKFVYKTHNNTIYK